MKRIEIVILRQMTWEPADRIPRVLTSSVTRILCTIYSTGKLT